MLTSIAAWAQNTNGKSYKYKDANGEIQTCNDPMVILDQPSLEGWCVVNQNRVIYIENQGTAFHLTGDTHIILCDNCTLTIEYTQAAARNCAIEGQRYNLTIYGGPNGTGKLVIKNIYGGLVGLSVSNLTVNGGTLDIKWASARTTTPAVGTTNFVINDGTVTVKLLVPSTDGIEREKTSGLCLSASNYYINGGTLYATNYNSSGNVVFGRAFCEGSTLMTAGNMAGKTMSPAPNGTYHAVTVPENVIVTGNGVGYGGNHRYFVPSGESITLTAAEGYGVSGIESTGGTVDGSTISGFDCDITVTCNVDALTDIVFTISYSLNGGSLPDGATNPTSYQYNTPTFTLVNPVRKGYSFSGWRGTGISYGLNGKSTVTIEQGSVGDRSYSANWVTSMYQIGYKLEGGHLEDGVSNPRAFTITDSDITLNNPVRTGYRFDGWTDSNGGTPQTTVVIPHGFTEPRTFTAHWTALYSGFAINTDNNGKTTAVFSGNSSEEVVINGAIDVDNVELNRDFQQGVYSTIVLPFSAAIPEGAGKFYEFKGVKYENGKWTADMSPVSTLAANTPYIFEPSQIKTSLSWNVATSLQTSASPQTIVKDPDYGDWTFKGTYTPIEFADFENQDKPIYGFAGTAKNNISVGEFVRAHDRVSIKPLRCYLEYLGNNATLLSKSTIALPDRIEVRIINAVVEPDKPTENPDSDVTTPTSELTPSLTDAKVWSYAHTIYIAAAPNTPYRIIDASGRVLKDGITATDRDEIRLGNHGGIAIVIINGKSFKVNY